jgi:DTW domain-containing protein YfiP
MKQAYKDANPQELKDALDAVYTPQTRNFVVFPGEEKNMTILERNAEKSAK